MVNVRVRALKLPESLIAVAREIRFHILVDFFLQVNANSAIDADDLVGADTAVGRDVAIGVGNADIGGIIADGAVRACDGGSDETLGEGAAGRACRGRRLGAGKYGQGEEQECGLREREQGPRQSIFDRGPGVKAAISQGRPRLNGKTLGRIAF